MSEPTFTNALAKETSPYLLQHAHNPVDWYPWGKEALEKAKATDRPILLSIGYSACHWCHVMERESFEDEEIASIMNRHFINIKVDREERPDLDAIYMNAVQMMTGRGGWPMTMFLTPDQIPFYGGTYFPPVDHMGTPGFRRVLLSVATAYREKRSQIEQDPDAMIDRLVKMNQIPDGHGELSTKILEQGAAQLKADYDSQHGGFGQAPKFPPSMSLSFLMRMHLRTGERRLLEIVEHTLQKMACGGMYDQLGGGFHRYSVDAVWLVPHFEKMLYDNALLSRAYLDAFLLTRNGFYRRVVEETLDYVMREMTSPEGGFYSSEDADSEGEEGKFYVWTRADVEEILGTEDDLFCRYYDISREGNFEGKSILNVPREGSLVARLNKVTEEEFRQIIQRGREKLLKERAKRIKPGRDEKILTAWNGLMLRSFAEAANGLGRDDYRAAALKNAEFLMRELQVEGRLLRSYKDCRARFNGYLEDYANVIDGFLSLYETTFDVRWLEEAERLAGIVVDRFWDSQQSDFYLTSEDHESLIHRPKDIYDNATPSGNSVAMLALLRLGKFTAHDKWTEYAVSTMEGMAQPMGRHPAAFSHLLCALDFRLARCREIALVGDPDSPETRTLLDTIFGRYMPNKVVACGLQEDTFLLKDRSQTEGRPTAYVCEGHVCQAPTTDQEELAAQFGDSHHNFA